MYRYFFTGGSAEKLTIVDSFSKLHGYFGLRNKNLLAVNNDLD